MALELRKLDVLKNLQEARDILINKGICSLDGSGNQEIEKMLAIFWGILAEKITIKEVK
jgi:hypothetical protein